MDIRIHQIYYRDDQKPLLDPAFIPYDNTGSERAASPDYHPDWREYHVFRREFFRGSCRDDAITGYVSWKFPVKAKTTGACFQEFIRSHPGHDVYFVNPPGLVPPIYDNVWLQGEHHHPGLIEITEALLRHIGRPLALATLSHPAEAALYCNYFAGNGAFWRRYMELCESVYRAIEQAIDPALRSRIDSRADRKVDVCYRPYIIERLFTTLLAVDDSICWIGYPGTPPSPP